MLTKFITQSGTTYRLSQQSDFRLRNQARPLHSIAYIYIYDRPESETADWHKCDC